MDKRVVKELNSYLKGEYMAVKAYEGFIARTKDDGVRKELNNIRNDHKQHAAVISERISSLGGKPAKGPGFMGIMSDIKNFVNRNNDDTRAILKDAETGEYRGVRMAEEIVKGDLDAESLKLVENLLTEDRSHVGRLKGLLH